MCDTCREHHPDHYDSDGNLKPEFVKKEGEEEKSE